MWRVDGTNAFVQRAVALRGPDARAWAESIPVLVAELRDRWSLQLETPFPRLDFNYVAPVRRADGAEAVLKLVFPGEPEFATEVAALALYDGRGSVRLLDADVAGSAMLLERLHPGTSLTELADDDAATGIIAELLSQLWRPVPDQYPFPRVSDWAMGFERLRRRYGGTTGPLPSSLVDTAEKLFRELLASTTEVAVLHGDLHHGNVLAAQRQPWLAIDPKGVVGDPAYDTAALLRNPLPELLAWPGMKRILARRIDLLSERLGFPRPRIHAWGLAQTVLSAVWALEDEGAGWEPAVACAEVLADLQS